MVEFAHVFENLETKIDTYVGQKTIAPEFGLEASLANKNTRPTYGSLMIFEKAK